MKFNRLVALVLILVALACEPCISLFAVILTYVVSGPALFLFGLSHQREDEETEIG
ncbi:MAG: hypothetical protein GY737_15810 [Desulfobacteraceae bacterium]|nr:hypothetical protein [Desulfobacteraceae bacterium]